MGRGDRNKVSSSGKMFALSLEMFKLSFMINKEPGRSQSRQISRGILGLSYELLAPDSLDSGICGYYFAKHAHCPNCGMLQAVDEIRRLFFEQRLKI